MSTLPRIKPLHGVGQPPFAGVDFSRIARWLTRDELADLNWTEADRMLLPMI